MNRIFSGVQPTGNLHLGNYLGAIKNFVSLQEEYKNALCLYCVVDMHAVTVWQEPKKLNTDIREVAAAFIATGVKPKESIIFNQSKVASHSELAWIFNCIARVGWLNRMTQFKEKAGKNRENASVGLYTYPILMAADILSYKANLVPVGDDQRQHLELAKNIAQKFNHDYKVDLFPEIKPIIAENVARVMSLRDGRKKMSKSEESDYSRINLLDEKDEIINKIKKAKTDLDLMPDIKSLDHKGNFLESVVNNRPEIVNLINIHSAVTGNSIYKTITKIENYNFSKFKKELSDLLIECLCPIGNEIRYILKDTSYIDKVLKEGSEKAEKISYKVLEEVKNILGFV